MRTSTAAILSAMLALPGAAPALAASFDCRQAVDHPMEQLICGEPALSALDDRMAAAYKARRTARDPAVVGDQRRWSDARYDLCGVPTVGDDRPPPLKLRQRMIPCVIDLYRQRIDELDGTATPPAADPGFVHPWCLAGLVGPMRQGEAAAARLSVCNAGGARMRVIGNSSVGYLVGGINDQWDGPGGKNWLSYRGFGTLPDGRELLVVTTHAGAGRRTASDLVALDRRTDGSIAATRLLAGGDRCGGGIVDATPRPDGIDVHVDVTREGFLHAIAGKAYYSADDAPWDCFGTLAVHLPAGGGAATVQGATLTVPADQQQENDCVRAAIRSAPPAPPEDTYAAAAFPSLDQAVHRFCPGLAD